MCRRADSPPVCRVQSRFFDSFDAATVVLPDVSPVVRGGEMGPPMSVDLQPDLRPSYLEHRAMRIDAERLQSVVSSARPADAERLMALASWYARYEGAIHDHHTAEEAVICPALLERDSSFADADGELEAEHRILADRLAVTRATTAWPARCASPRLPRRLPERPLQGRRLRNRSADMPTAPPTATGATTWRFPP